MVKKTTIDDLARMVKHGFDSVDRNFGDVRERLERIEKLILAEHKRRIEQLEVEMKNIKELLAIK